VTLPATFDRWIVLVSPTDAGEAAISFDFLSSQGKDAVLRRARISALAMFGDPEAFDVIGARAVARDADDETVELAVQAIAAGDC
jgi:hypothetical protein